MKELFGFQSLFTDELSNAFRKNKRVIGQLPTGGGKGVILTEIAKRAMKNGKVVCISCHREEIFQQLFSNLMSIGVSPGIIAAGVTPVGGKQCYLSMVETVYRRMQKNLIERLNIDFFILDEVHYGSYFKLLDELKCHVLGFTATPKSQGERELKDSFDTIICGPSVQSLIDLKRLVPTTTFSIDHDFSKVKKNSKGEYEDRALSAEFRKPKLWRGAVDSYMKHASTLQALAFSVDVEQSNSLCIQLLDLGIKAAHVDANSSDRKLIFDMYRKGDIQVLCNVGIATTGTDLPMTRCIIKNFATTSLVKNAQIDGRGARCDGDKEKFVTIDMGRNYIRHGEFGEFIDWEKIYANPSLATRKDSMKTKRECKSCGGVIRISLSKCPFCNHTVPQKAMEEMLTEDATTKEIRTYKLQQMPIHLRKPLVMMSNSELKEYGRYMGYKPSWFYTVKTHIRK